MKFQGMTVALFAVAVGAAHAGVVIHNVERSLPNGKERANQTMYVQNGMMRIDVLDERGHVTDMTIYRDGILWDVNVAERSYRKIDKAAMQQASQQINQAMEQMKARMANMPPERRAVIEKMMAGRQGSAASHAPEITWGDTGRTEHVAERSCHLWESKRGGAIMMQYCVISPAKLPGGEETYSTMRSFAKSFKDAFSGMPERMRQAAARSMAWFEKANGYPILTRSFERGKPFREESLKSIDQQNVPADKFAIPKGFKAVAFGPHGGGD